MVGSRAYCRSHTLDRINHELRTSGVAFARIHTPNKSLLNPAESYSSLSVAYRFGSIHNILVSLFREHPATTHGHNATTW